MFMETLEGIAWSWYEGLPSASIYSLKDFHSALFEKYRDSHSSLSLVEDSCEHFEVFIQNIENYYVDEEFMDEEILEALYENPFHHQEEHVSSPLDESETEQDLNDDIKQPIDISEEQGNAQPCFNEVLCLCMIVMFHPMSLMNVCSRLVSLLIRGMKKFVKSIILKLHV